MDVTEINYDENGNIDFDSLNKYMEANFPQPKVRWWHRFKREYIVTKYDSHESINTEPAYCKFFLRLKYRHYKSFVINPPLWLAFKLHKWFGWRTLRESNVKFERVDPSKDQVKYWQPWMNVN